MVLKKSNSEFEYLLKKIKTNLKIFYEPENYLIEKLDKNPFHPFKQISSYLFECNYKYNYSGIISSTLSILFAFTSVVNFIEIFNYKCFLSWFTLLLIIFLSIFFLLLSLLSLTKRTIRLNLLQNNYEVFIGDKKIASNHLHNLYIRLNEKNILKTKLVYRLMLCGKDVDNISISPYSYNLQLFRQLGQRLAQNLFLNYFDIHDLSSHHSILNYCPLNKSKIDLWKFLFQEDKIILQKKPIYWLKPNLIRNKFKIKSMVSSDKSKTALFMGPDEKIGQNKDVSPQELKKQLSKLANTLKAVKTLYNIR